MVQGIIIILLLAVCVILGYATVRLNNLLDIKEKKHDELKARHFQVIKNLDDTRNQLNDARADIEVKINDIDRLKNEKSKLLNEKSKLLNEINALKATLDETQKNVEELTKKIVKSEEPAKKTTTRKPRTKKAE